MVVEASYAVSAGVAVVRSLRRPVKVADSAVAKVTQPAASHSELVMDLASHQL